MKASLFPPQHADAIEQEIDGYFAAAIAEAPAHGSYKYLWESLYELIKAGGKRFRPKMMLLAYQAFGGEEAEKVIGIAAAQELLHFSLLIHDDIIDRDYMRYGVANIAGRYKMMYQKHVKRPEDQVHFAHSAAILGGDLMLSGAYQLIMNSQASYDQKHLAHQLLSKGIFDVAGGELQDTELSFLPYEAGDALEVALYKTARYSFVVPLLTGAKLTGIAAEQEVILQRYAEALGIAYQLVDDMLGVFGVEEDTGKSVIGDIREGKRTCLVEQAMAAFSPEEKLAFTFAFGNPTASPAAILEAKQLLISSGARAKTEAMIAHYRQAAGQAVSQLTLSAPEADKLRQLITLATERTF